MLARTVVIAILLAVLATPAAADYERALVLGIGYATGPPTWTPWTNLPNLEDSLWIYGTVAQANAPFTDLLPPGGYELTYVFDSYACSWSTYAEDMMCIIAYLAFFDVGTLRVFLDTTPDADFANPATFRDGVQVLVATAYPLQLFKEEHCMNGIRYVQQAFMRFTGGVWFARVSREGVGFVGHNEGQFWGDIPQGLSALGYIGQSQSVVDVVVPNAIETTTWGRIKAMYR